MSKIIQLITLTVSIAALAASIFVFQQNQQLKRVTNTQGQVIMLLIETPEIATQLQQEIDRRKNKQQ